MTVEPGRPRSSGQVLAAVGPAAPDDGDNRGTHRQRSLPGSVRDRWGAPVLPTSMPTDPDVDVHVAAQRAELRRARWSVLGDERIRAFLPQLDELVDGGLVIIDPVEVIRYVGRDR